MIRSFIKENPTLVGVSEFALRLLINEKDSDIRANAIQKIVIGVSKGHAMEAVNINHIINGLKEGKVKSGRPVKNSNEKIIERDEEVNISKALRPVEEVKAKERQEEGGKVGGEIAGKYRPKNDRVRETFPKPKKKQASRARDNIAAYAGISRDLRFVCGRYKAVNA